MIVIASVESREQHFALVHGGVENAIAIHVGVDDEIRRVGDDDLVADHRDAERRHQRGLLHERRGLVGAAVSVGVFEHHHAVTLRIALLVAAIVHAFGDPDAPRRIDVDVGRVLQHRRACPQRHFEAFGHREDLERHDVGRRTPLGRGAVVSDADRRPTADAEQQKFHGPVTPQNESAATYASMSACSPSLPGFALPCSMPNTPLKPFPLMWRKRFW